PRSPFVPSAFASARSSLWLSDDFVDRGMQCPLCDRGLRSSPPHVQLCRFAPLQGIAPTGHLPWSAGLVRAGHSRMGLKGWAGGCDAPSMQEGVVQYLAQVLRG